jgi:hypothetical protein
MTEEGKTMTTRYSFAKPFFFAAVLVTLAACGSDVTGTNKQMVQLSFTTNASSVAATGIRVSPDITVGANGDLVLSKIQVVVDKIELNENENTSCVGEIEQSGDDDHAEAGEECEEIARDPVLIDIPVDDAAHTLLSVPLTPGTFNKLEAKLEPSRNSAFDAANPNLVGKSVRVEGTFKGTPFVFTSAVRLSLEMEFNPPLVIDATTTNATVSINVAKWFLDRNGNVIDPTTATSGSESLSQIEANIRRSFHAFEDDDHSGEDDHEEHHG